MRWLAEKCKKCGRRNIIGFSVDDNIWDLVTENNYTVLCPACFDVMAQKKMIKYKFKKLFPVTWAD